MPLPIILAGVAAVGATIIGAVGHADAKEVNEKARDIVNEAEDLYKGSRHSLEVAQREVKDSLLVLGNSKKRVFETSVHRFLDIYEHVKNVELKDSAGLNEIKKFKFEKQDALRLREMSDGFQLGLLGGTSGALAGTIALAASGSLPALAELSFAGSCLAMGEIALAAEIFAPLSAIIAPAVFFSGIGASMKADENLEKAETMYAEAKEASEKMKTSKVLCVAIAKRADMFNKLLNELDRMFLYCTDRLDVVVKKKMYASRSEIVDARTLSEDEYKLFMVTRSLAGAVKSVIDTPILDADGRVSVKSTDICNNIQAALPELTTDVMNIKI